MSTAGYDRVKRGIDVVVAGALLLLTAIPQLAVAGRVLACLGRPALFRQTRIGLRGRLFTIVKFRTMRPLDPARGPISDADRLTRLGSWLRATSLDELPTLWCVLKGDMSLIGPRPLLEAYLGRYTPEQARRHDVRPGITGLAQVSGRTAITWEERFACDVLYVRTRSAGLDLWILGRTLVDVVRRRGISAPGHATMPEFLPNERATLG
jgi:lipopolysaccharide/colanic/teichoic acid biosynthesis glycosyltransferase